MSDGATRTTEQCLLDDPANIALASAPLDTADVNSLVEFFLLLKKWDTLSTQQVSDLPSHTRRSDS